MKNNFKVFNAQIIDAFLGFDDHGILTFYLTLKISDGSYCSFGGIRIARSTIEIIGKILNTVGVAKWEDLKGKFLRVYMDEWDAPIKEIGNLMYDKWLDIDEVKGE